MFARRFGLVLIFAGALAGRSALTLAQTPATPPANAVTYTEDQATRGAELFSNVCLECHARKDVSDLEFKGKWRGRSAFDFFERVRSTMPERSPGSLARADYLNVTAYVARLNGLPAGEVELPDDEAALKKMVLAFPQGGQR